MTSGPMSPTLFEQCHRSFYVPFQHLLKYKYEGDKANSLTSPPNDTIIWTEKGVLQLAWSYQFFKDLGWWPGQGLNSQHPAQQTGALPTELTGHPKGSPPGNPWLFVQSSLQQVPLCCPLLGGGQGGQPLVPRPQMERPVKGLPDCSKIFLYFFFHLKCLF